MLQETNQLEATRQNDLHTPFLYYCLSALSSVTLSATSILAFLL